MTLDQARQCLAFGIWVEDRDDEDMKTGVIVRITAGYAFVRWDDDEGSVTPVAFSDLMPAYEEHMRGLPEVVSYSA